MAHGEPSAFLRPIAPSVKSRASTGIVTGGMAPLMARFARGIAGLTVVEAARGVGGIKVFEGS